MISEFLIPALRNEFSGWEIDFSPEAPVVAAFPESQKAMGRVLIYDDGDEATISIEHITHGHFGNYDESLATSEKEKVIVEDVIEFLKALFADRVLLFKGKSIRFGGWYRLDLNDAPIELSQGRDYYLWSKPYPNYPDKEKII